MITRFLSGLLVGALLATPLAAQVTKQGKFSKADRLRSAPVELGAETMTDVIDFAGLPAGTVLGEVYGAGGLGPVSVRGQSPAFGAGVNAALVFDSASRTGGDGDLGTPNEDFGGPGIDAVADGLGGEAGSPFQNDVEQHEILILAEDLIDANDDGLIDDPDDGDLEGGFFVFDFSALGSVTIHAMMILDVEAEEGDAIVGFFDALGDPVAPEVALPHTGDNGLAVVDLGNVPDVVMMTVMLNGSGAIDDIKFSVDVPCDARLGDRVWVDLDCDGTQDDGEPGIPGVRVILKDADGNVVGKQLTDGTGHYLFTDLCAGEYSVCVDPATLPPGYAPAPCNVGDDALDNDCTGVVVVLEQGEDDRSVDFGYCEPPTSAGTEGCTPGYWKQPHHFDSWPAPYTPDTLFADVFDDAFPGKTLVQVLAQGGGGLKALGRHTVAALLNSTKLDYGVSAGEVIALFNANYPGNDYEGLKNIFADRNEDQPCPLN